MSAVGLRRALRLLRAGCVSVLLLLLALAIAAARPPSARAQTPAAEAPAQTEVRARVAAVDTLPYAGTPYAEAPLLLTTAASRALLAEGRAALFDFRMPAAERLFYRLAARPDGAPAAYHHLTLAALLRAVVTEDQAPLDAFFARSDSLHALLAAHPARHRPWARYLDAEGRLLRALARAQQQDYLKAALAARKAFGRYDDLVRDEPAFPEPYLGMGLLHLAVGTLPSTYRTLLGLVGFSGTAEEGWTELERAAAEGHFSRPPARLILALADLVLHRDPARGFAQVEALHAQRPQSLLFGWIYGYALLERRRGAEARRVLQAAVDRAQTDAYAFVDYVEYFLAEAHFVANDFAAAEPYYRRYLARHRGPALRATALLRLGLALEMQGERATACVMYEQVKATRDYDTDQVAARHARLRLAHPLTPRQRTLLRGRNAFDAGRDAEAERLLRRVAEAPAASDAERGEAHYRLGRVLHEQGRLEAAAAHYRRAARQPGDDEAKWRGWGWHYLGEVRRAQGRYDAAQAAYDRALAEPTPFDFYQALEQAARLARDDLRRQQAAAAR